MSAPVQAVSHVRLGHTLQPRTPEATYGPLPSKIAGALRRKAREKPARHEHYALEIFYGIVGPSARRPRVVVAHLGSVDW